MSVVVLFRKIFAKISSKGLLGRLSSAQREDLLAEALKDRRLAMVLIGSTVVLPNIPQKPTTKPIKPVRSSKVVVTRYSPKYARQNAKRVNLESKLRFERELAQHAINLKNFKDKGLEYKNAIQRAKDVE